MPRSGGRALALLVGAVMAAGALATATVLLVHGTEVDLSWALWIVAAFILLAELLPMPVPGHDAELSLATPFLFALLLMDGPAAVVVVQVVSALVTELARRKALHRALYNAGQLALSWGVAGTLWQAVRVPGVSPLVIGNVPAALAVAVVFSVLNLSLARAPVALVTGARLLATLRAGLGFEVWTTVILFSLGPVVVALAGEHPALLPLLALPTAAIHRGGRSAVAHAHLAAHDTLTGLGNRTLVRERLDAALTAAASHLGVAVLLLDLDEFKDINDTLGHHNGDEVLKLAAGRLLAVAPAGATVGRLGGDEFAVIVPGAGSRAAAGVALAIHAALEAPFELAGLILRAGASIGIACAPEHGTTAGGLLQHADVAMYTAKERREPYAVYEEEQDQHSPIRLQLAGELREALDQDALALHYQPLIRLDDGRLDRVEALVRWRHAERGMVPPDLFVGLAERTGLIRQLTDFTLREAVRQLVVWREQGFETRIAVNLSAHNLMDERLPERVAELLHAAAVSPAMLELELTETMIMADPARAQRILQQLRDLGVELAVDDFGTGHSSLGYLKRLPVSSLKIDRSFVSDMADDASNAMIVRATIEMARSLRLDVTAEGVETAEVRERLRRLGCQRAQGYLFSRPCPPDELRQWAAGRPAVTQGVVGVATVQPG